MKPQVSNKDARRVLDAISRLHGIDDPASLPAAMRSAAGALVSGEIVAYSEFDLVALAKTEPAERDLDAIHRLAQVSPFVVTDDSSTDREIADVTPWMVRYAEEHPLFSVALFEPDPPVSKISDHLSLPQFRDHALYKQFFRPLSVTRQIAVCPTPCEGGLVTGLTINRSGRDFSERDRNCLALLAPHLRESFRAAVSRARLADALKRQRQSIDRIPYALLALTPDGSRVQFETESAREILIRCFPGVEGRGLPQRLKDWVRDLLRRRGDLEHPQAVNASCRFQTDAGVLRVRFVEKDKAVFLLLRLNDATNVPQRLMELGLTRREAEVLECLRDGGTNRQIASRLCVAPGTIRTHIERILSKLGVATRTAAVRRADEFLWEFE